MGKDKQRILQIWKKVTEEIINKTNNSAAFEDNLHL